MSEQARIVPMNGQEGGQAHRGAERRDARFMYDLQDFSYAVKKDDRLVAGVVAESTGDRVEVSYLYVHEGHRGQGLGTALMEHLEERAVEAGMSRILLDTYSFQAPGLYRKLGYTEAAVLPASEGHTHHYFVKELAGREPVIEQDR